LLFLFHSSFVLLCGSLLRIREWNAASLSIIHSGAPEASNLLTPWSQLLKSNIYSTAEFIHMPLLVHCMWRGSVVLNVAQQNVRFTFTLAFPSRSQHYTLDFLSQCKHSWETCGFDSYFCILQLKYNFGCTVVHQRIDASHCWQWHGFREGFLTP
jgi:hypothetical protein